jgi:hypothetical protein
MDEPKFCKKCQLEGKQVVAMRRIETAEGPEGLCNKHAQPYLYGGLGAVMRPVKPAPENASLPEAAAGSVAASSQQKGEELMSRGKYLDIDQLKSLVAEGLTVPEIHERTAIPISSLYGAIRRLGLVAKAARHRWGGRSRPDFQMKDAPQAADGSSHSRLPQNAAIMKRTPSQLRQLVERTEQKADGRGQARCRVAMFEIEGPEASILAAVEAVKAALAGKTT